MNDELNNEEMSERSYTDNAETANAQPTDSGKTAEFEVNSDTNTNSGAQQPVQHTTAYYGNDNSYRGYEYHYQYGGANRQTKQTRPTGQYSDRTGGYNNGYNYNYNYNTNSGYNNASQNQNGNYGYSSGTGYNGYGYTAPVAQPQKKKKNGGKWAAIIAVAALLVLVFSLMAFAAGVLYQRNTNGNRTDPETSDTVPSDPGTGIPAVKPEDSAKTTERQSPVTDPTATLSIGGSSDSLSMTEAAAKAVNSVVEIRTEAVVQGTFMQQYISEGAGSGVIVTSDGYIATNNHVIEDATTITVILRDGTEYPATLVGRDEQADLAVVKIEATGLSAASFGDSDKLIVAQTVLAIGNPLGELGGSVTEGIISSLARTVTIENQEMTLLQTTAAINPGNSGGGLFNLSGECIGIVNAKSSGTDIEGIGFAIPANTAVDVIEDLMKYGYVRGRVMLGISMAEITDTYTARRNGVSELGVYVASVASGSDAEKGGIQARDRLVSVKGTDVETYAQVKKIIQSCKAGETITVVVSRNGEKITLEITLSEYIPD